MTHRLRFLLLCIAVAGAPACGTTSSLQAPDDTARIDLTPYRRLLVQDFTDEATASAKPEAQPLLQPKVSAALTIFPDQIASVMRATGAFEEVSRDGTPDASTLVLRGAITQFDAGNAALRWIVDKNSWALGGGIAASQTPEGFMEEAAGKIGTELASKRKEGSVKRPGS